jgi:tetratricopeptide (TPR) repeat protein
MKKIKKEDLDKAKLHALNGEYPQAIKIFLDLLAHNPKDPEISLYLGIAYLKSHNYRNALNVLQKILIEQPKTPLLCHGIGSAFFMLDEYENALIYFDKEITINPYYPDVYCDKSKALHKLKRWNEALTFASLALDLDANFDEAHLCMASSLNQLNSFEESYGAIKKIRNINDMGYIYYSTLSDIYSNHGKKIDALEAIDRAIKMEPNEKEIIFNKALLLLATCQFEEAWPLYEYRPYNPIDVLGIESKKNKWFIDKNNTDSVFILKEQGVGDHILYGSLLADLDTQKTNFYVEIDIRLIPTFARSFRNIKFVGSVQELPINLVTFKIGMGDLPGLIRNNFNSFKYQKNYFLQSDTSKTNLIKNKIKKIGFKICGISWKSSNHKIGSNKSIDLSEFIDILRIPNIIFVNIQYGSNPKEIINFCNQFNLKILSFDDLDIFNDIDSLFSLIDACDFVVTISNINAHIAGALGKKTFLLAPFSKGRIWYWHDGLKTSLWYPSIQIFTQTGTGDWSVPINEIKEKIVEEISHE